MKLCGKCVNQQMYTGELRGKQFEIVRRAECDSPHKASKP